MDRQVFPARVVHPKTSSKHRPVQHRVDDMQGFGSPHDRVESTFQVGLRSATRESSGQDASPLMSPPYLGPSLVTVQLFKGVFFKPEDFETGVGSPNQPQQVNTQEQANGTLPISFTNNRMISTHPQSSSTVIPLSLLSTSTHHNHQDVIANYCESQPPTNSQTNKRKMCESEKEVDDDDSVQWLDDGEEKSSLPVKKPTLVTKRSENAQPKVVRQSQRQAAEDEQQKKVNKQNGQVITLALQCPEWNCSQMFTTNQHTTAVDQLNHHLKVVHSIGLHRCVVLYCAESFPSSRALGQHIKHFHAGIVEWHCSKCPKHFATCQILFQHTTEHHQLGQFECSFRACTFTAECKAKVATHYGNHHRDTLVLVCQAKTGCVYRTTNRRLLKEHERAHLGIKPYRCQWINCRYSCVSLSGAIKHIKQVHFKTSKKSHVVEMYGKPSDYISVDRSLL